MKRKIVRRASALVLAHFHLKQTLRAYRKIR